MPSEALIRLALAKVQPVPSHAPQALQTADPLQATQKAQTIGPARVGDRYLENLNPSLVGIARQVFGGAARPTSVAAQDPYGIQAWLQGNGPMPTPIAAEIKAYHGSPHDFEKFLMEKIGTGEGAQAYGHGLYFSENPAVANEYKRTLGNRAFKVGDRELVSPMGGSTRALDTQTRGENIATQALDDAFNAQSSSPAQFAASRLRSQARVYPEEAAHIDEALKIISEWQKTGEVQKLGGHTYEVAIKADPEHFLDWDKPLIQQSEQVQALIRKRDPHLFEHGYYNEKLADPDIPSASAGRRLGVPAEDMTGRSYYQLLARQKATPGVFPEILVPRPAEATTEARKIGLAGIKYLDQGSRGEGKGTSNYVVFDDKLIDILKKYAVVPPLAAGALSQLGQPTTQEGQ